MLLVSGLMLTLGFVERSTTVHAQDGCSFEPSGCPDQAGFKVAAYGGQIVKNAGKCLDYQPDVTGSPVVLNDCPAAHTVVVETIPNQRFEVFLRAGSKRIGVRRGPIILLRAAGGNELSTAASGDEELPLELQDPKTDPFGLADQTFALDGDSIILASDRNMVAKVHNARGSNGTPIVVGFRELSVEEFWDMRAADGSNRFPTAAFKPITTVDDLLTALGTAEPGHVLVINGLIELPRRLPPMRIP